MHSTDLSSRQIPHGPPVAYPSVYLPDYLESRRVRNRSVVHIGLQSNRRFLRIVGTHLRLACPIPGLSCEWLLEYLAVLPSMRKTKNAKIMPESSVDLWFRGEGHARFVADFQSVSGLSAMPKSHMRIIAYAKMRLPSTLLILRENAAQAFRGSRRPSIDLRTHIYS